MQAEEADHVVLVDAVARNADAADQLGAGGFGNADPAIRADRIVVPVGQGVRLRYVACPFAPFLGSTDQNVCQGK